MFSKCIKYLLLPVFLFIATIKGNSYPLAPVFEGNNHEILKGGIFRSSEGVMETSPEISQLRTLHENINQLKNIPGNTVLFFLSQKKSNTFINYLRVLNRHRNGLPRYLMNRNLLI